MSTQFKRLWGSFAAGLCAVGIYFGFQIVGRETSTGAWTGQKTISGALPGPSSVVVIPRLTYPALGTAPPFVGRTANATALAPWSKLLSDAIHARDPDSREIAVRFSLMCVSLQALPQPSLEGAKELNPSSPTVLLAEQMAARQKLQSYCASAPNSTTLIDDLHRAGIAATGPVAKAIIRGDRNGNAQEFYQASTMVLSNPSQFSAAFDTWLEHYLSPELQSRYGLSEAQSVAVQDMLYSTLTGSDGESFGEIRRQERCGLFGSCPSNTALSDSDFVTAQRVALQIQRQVQQQQWTALIPTR
jgi:hypothetical protein